jgi:hypothetical protein
VQQPVLYECVTGRRKNELFPALAIHTTATAGRRREKIGIELE